MSKAITLVAFFVLTTTGALVVACGDSPAQPPTTPSAPTTPGAPTAPAASSAAPTAPKGGW